jgi:hypothetical protein
VRISDIAKPPSGQKKSGSAMLPTSICGAVDFWQCCQKSKKIGSDNFVKPDFCQNIRKDLLTILSKSFRPQAALGTGDSPASGVLTSKRYACDNKFSQVWGSFLPRNTCQEWVGRS